MGLRRSRRLFWYRRRERSASAVLKVTAGGVSVNVIPSGSCRYARSCKLFGFAALQPFKFVDAVLAVLQIQIDDNNICRNRKSPQRSGPSFRPSAYCCFTCRAVLEAVVC